jgi:hypothetical protein
MRALCLRHHACGPAGFYRRSGIALHGRECIAHDISDPAAGTCTAICILQDAFGVSSAGSLTTLLWVPQWPWCWRASQGVLCIDQGLRPVSIASFTTLIWPHHLEWNETMNKTTFTVQRFILPIPKLSKTFNCCRMLGSYAPYASCSHFHTFSSCFLISGKT